MGAEKLADEAEILLELDNVNMAFGKVQALAGVNLKVCRGEIHSVIGPNGAGKTVMMNCINGLYRPQVGSLYFKGQKINHLSPHQRAKLGLARTFQKVEVFGGPSCVGSEGNGAPETVGPSKAPDGEADRPACFGSRGRGFLAP